MSDTMDVTEVAEMLRTDTVTVCRYARTGELPATRIGEVWIFLREDVITFLKHRIAEDTQARRQRRVGKQPNIEAVLVAKKSATRRTVLPSLPSLPQPAVPSPADHHK